MADQSGQGELAAELKVQWGQESQSRAELGDLRKCKMLQSLEKMNELVYTI